MSASPPSAFCAYCLRYLEKRSILPTYLRKISAPGCPVRELNSLRIRHLAISSARSPFRRFLRMISCILSILHTIGMPFWAGDADSRFRPSSHCLTAFSASSAGKRLPGLHRYMYRASVLKYGTIRLKGSELELDFDTDSDGLRLLKLSSLNYPMIGFFFVIPFVHVKISGREPRSGRRSHADRGRT